MVQHFIWGTQYIDELVMVRVKDKGDLYVHQDANWNVIGATDLGRHVIERSVYTPYGELTVHQDTGFGDRDGDQDVDSTDKGTVGTTCTGTVSGACRILDLDFDGDYDSTDAGLFDSLAQGAMRHPGRPATNVSQPFAHQGLLFEPELAQYQNRARQYDAAKRRFMRRDPLGVSGTNTNLYDYNHANPVAMGDPSGKIPLPFSDGPLGVPCSIGEGWDICNEFTRPDSNGNTWFQQDDSEGVSFCCWRQNPQWGNVWCEKKSCFESNPPHPCVWQHEYLRRNQFACDRLPIANQRDQCTDLGPCTEFLYKEQCKGDCDAYRELFQCYRGFGLESQLEQCMLGKMCGTECMTIQQAKTACGG